MSCRKDTSPISSVVARPRPKAKPAAVLMMPSMPLAPRLAAIGAPRAYSVSQIKVNYQRVRAARQAAPLCVIIAEVGEAEMAFSRR